MKFKKIATEFQECKAFVQWADFHPTIGPFLFHIPNEGERNQWERKKQHEQGLRPGIPDYMLAIPASGYHGCFIEMKRANAANHALRTNQKEWLDRLKQQGYFSCVCAGADSAIETVKKYLGEVL